MFEHQEIYAEYKLEKKVPRYRARSFRERLVTPRAERNGEVVHAVVDGKVQPHHAFPFDPRVCAWCMAQSVTNPSVCETCSGVYDDMRRKAKPGVVC